MTPLASACRHIRSRNVLLPSHVLDCLKCGLRRCLAKTGWQSCAALPREIGVFVTEWTACGGVSVGTTGMMVRVSQMVDWETVTSASR